MYVVEADMALSVTVAKSRTVGLPSEVDSAQTVVRVAPVMVRLSPVDIVRPGVEVSAGTPVDWYNGHVFANDGAVFLELENIGGTEGTVDVLVSPEFSSDVTVGNLVLTIPAGETWKFGPFKPRTFNQGLSGDVWLDPHPGATMKIRVYRMANVRYRR